MHVVINRRTGEEVSFKQSEYNKAFEMMNATPHTYIEYRTKTRTRRRRR